MDFRSQAEREEDLFLFDHFFGGLQHAKYFRLPNLVLPNRHPSLSLVLDTVGHYGAAWQNEPPFGRTDTPYISIDLAKHEYFRLWGTEANQQALRKRGNISRLGAFTMLLDATVPDNLLDWFDDNTQFGYTPLLEEIYPLVIIQIEALGWAFMPLSDEVPLALFVASHGNADLVSKILKSESLHTQIFVRDGRPTWHLSDELRKICKT